MSERPTTDCTAAGKDYFGSSEMSKPGDVPGPWNLPDGRALMPDTDEMQRNLLSPFFASQQGSSSALHRRSGGIRSCVWSMAGGLQLWSLQRCRSGPSVVGKGWRRRIVETEQ